MRGCAGLFLADFFTQASEKYRLSTTSWGVRGQASNPLNRHFFATLLCLERYNFFKSYFVHRMCSHFHPGMSEMTFVQKKIQKNLDLLAKNSLNKKFDPFSASRSDLRLRSLISIL